MRATGVGVLDKVAAILEVFAADDRALSPQDVAAAVGMPLPTVYRLVQAMAEHGLLDRDGSVFQLGHTLMYLGARAADKIDLRRRALPALTELNELSGESVHLAVRRGEIRVIVELVHSPKNIRPFAQVGDPLPLSVGASSKVLLSGLPDAQALNLAATSAARFGLDGSLDRTALQEELAAARRDRVVVSVGTYNPDTSGIAAPVFGPGGVVVAAISLVAPTVRLGLEKQRELVPAVVEAARRTSASLGYRDASWVA